MEKLEWCGYTIVKILTICLLVLTEYTNVTNTQTDRTSCDGIGRIYAEHRAAKTKTTLSFASDRQHGNVYVYEIYVAMAVGIFANHSAHSHNFFTHKFYTNKCIV